MPRFDLTWRPAFSQESNCPAPDKWQGQVAHVNLRRSCPPRCMQSACRPCHRRQASDCDMTVTSLLRDLTNTCSSRKATDCQRSSSEPVWGRIPLSYLWLVWTHQHYLRKPSCNSQPCTVSDTAQSVIYHLLELTASQFDWSLHKHAFQQEADLCCASASSPPMLQLNTQQNTLLPNLLPVSQLHLHILVCFSLAAFAHIGKSCKAWNARYVCFTPNTDYYLMLAQSGPGKDFDQLLSHQTYGT